MFFKKLIPFVCPYCLKNSTLGTACFACHRTFLKNLEKKQETIHNDFLLQNNYCFLYNKQTQKVFRALQNENNSRTLLLTKKYILQQSSFLKLCNENNIEIILCISTLSRHNFLMPSTLELLGMQLAKAANIQFIPNAFYKTRKTWQRKLKSEERYDQAMFLAMHNKIKNKVNGKNIILFDDIYTTGTSALQAMVLLHKAGARFINLFTLGYSPFF